ncbi:MAG: NAD(+)/NADH kinase [Kiritimatiellia bacterium]
MFFIHQASSTLTRISVKRIAFHVNSDKSGARDACARLVSWATEIGLQVEDESPDAVVVLGGDGTMLSAVHRFPGIPLLGLNLGSLGYLSGVETPRFDDAIRALRANAFTISNRTALSVRDRIALNEVVVSRGVSGHAAVIELAVDDRPATSFFADGLVIATPTGSTAYSLAAGGPILLPDSQSLVITPICPHALTSRPLVIPDSSTLSVRLCVRPGAETLEVFADGASLGTLTGAESLHVAKSAVGVPLIELEGYDPYVVLNRKLGWSGSSIR